MDELTRCDVVPYGGIPEVHRQRAEQNDERLFLLTALMALSLCAGLIPPDVAARVPEPSEIAQLDDVPCRFAGVVRPSDPFPAEWTDDTKAHAVTLRAHPRPQRVAGAGIQQ